MAAVGPRSLAAATVGREGLDFPEFVCRHRDKHFTQSNLHNLVDFRYA